MRQHGIDDDAGDRDVKPQREGVTGDGAVEREASREREEEGNQDHRQRDDRREDVWGEQDPEIEEAGDGVRGGKVCVAVQRVVGDVGDQEERREEERGKHAGAVFRDRAMLDVRDAEEQGDGAEGVQRGVERREEGKLGAGDVRRRVKVDEPDEEERGGEADRDDRSDDAQGSAEDRNGLGRRHEL